MPVILKQIAAPDVPVEADNVTPARLSGLGAAAVEKLTLMHGSEARAIGEFFSVSGEYDGVIEVQGEHLDRVKFIGAGMAAGTVRVEGNVGEHLGAGMSGGEIQVNGHAADWVGPEMSGGRIEVHGNAGHMTGSAYRGAAVGMTGGEIIIHGNVRNETGNAMRGGLIAVAGNSGDFTGVNMLSGSIFVFGELGIRSGAGMKRGSIVSMHDAPLLPTFSYSCTYYPPYLTLYLLHLATVFNSAGDYLQRPFKRFCGDSVELDRGEILLYAGPEQDEFPSPGVTPQRKEDNHDNHRNRQL